MQDQIETRIQALVTGGADEEHDGLLPLSFVTSLFGVSLAGIPFASEPDAFWVLLWILALIIVIEIALFRWSRWF